MDNPAGGVERALVAFVVVKSTTAAKPNSLKALDFRRIMEACADAGNSSIMLPFGINVTECWISLGG